MRPLALAALAGASACQATEAPSHAADSVVATGSPDISIEFVTKPGSFVADTAILEATATSKYELSSFVARAAGRQATFAADPQPSCGACFKAALDLHGLPVAPIDLSLIATDVRGATRTVTGHFVHDNPPRIRVDAPLDLTAATGALHVSAQCTDDSGSCASFSVGGLAPAQPYFQTSASHIDQDIALQRTGGQLIRFEAVDAVGQHAFVDRFVYLVANPHFTALATAPFGRALDFRDNTLLYMSDSLIEGERAGVPNTVWRQPVAAAPESLFTRTAVTRGFLTSHGAVVLTTSTGTSSVFEWRDGTVLLLNDGYAASGFMVNGDFAAWSNGSVGGAGLSGLYRRDFTDGTTVVVTPDKVVNSSVAANGDVAWTTTTYDVRWLHGGSIQALTSDGATAMNTNPLTDGNLVTYLKGPVNTPQIAAWINGAEQIFGPGTVGGARVENGWLAFITARAPSPTPHVWTRAPDGTIRQVDQFAHVVSLDALGPDGTVVLGNGDDDQLYISAPPYTAVSALGQPEATVVVRNGGLIALIGRTAFRVTP